MLHLQNLARLGHHGGRLFQAGGGGSRGGLLRQLNKRVGPGGPGLLQHHGLRRRELDRCRHHGRHLLLLLQRRLLLLRHVHGEGNGVRQPGDLQHHVVARRRRPRLHGDAAGRHLHHAALQQVLQTHDVLRLHRLLLLLTPVQNSVRLRL